MSVSEGGEEDEASGCGGDILEGEEIFQPDPMESLNILQRSRITQAWPAEEEKDRVEGLPDRKSIKTSGLDKSWTMSERDGYGYILVLSRMRAWQVYSCACAGREFDFPVFISTSWWW
jgi:hypothetical protein